MTLDRDALRRAMFLYAVTDSSWLIGRSLDDCVAAALRGGATCVQLREKGASTEDLVAAARRLIPVCRSAGVPFIINDDVEAARIAGADGVHVGQGDMACACARSVLGPNAVVGVSVQTVAQALAAEEAQASYLGVGAMIGTRTKPSAEIVSRERLREICQAVDIPVVAIGGLNAGSASCLIGSGVDGAAVVSAIFSASDIELATKRLAHVLKDVLDPPEARLGGSMC